VLQVQACEGRPSVCGTLRGTLGLRKARDTGALPSAQSRERILAFQESKGGKRAKEMDTWRHRKEFRASPRWRLLVLYNICEGIVSERAPRAAYFLSDRAARQVPRWAFTLSY